FTIAGMLRAPSRANLLKSAASDPWQASCIMLSKSLGRLGMLGKLIGGLATALVAVALSGGAARADVITFFDLTDIVTFTHTGTSTTITGSCSGETCRLTLSRPGQT